MIGAVDIGGTKFAVGVVNESGEVLARAETPSHPELGLQPGLARMFEMLHAIQEETGQRLQGIGIGCTGPVDPYTGQLGLIEFLPGWEWFNLVDAFEQEFQVPVFIENDADAATLGEAAWGAGKNAERMMYVTISTGIGAGLVIHGQLYRGAGGSHPEYGHHVIDFSGPKCFCGAYGCWESLASGTAMAKRSGGISAYEICLAAQRGEAWALSAVEQEGLYLGIGLANLITLFVPDVIALGGGVMQSRTLFWDKITTTIQNSCGLVPFKRTLLVPALLGKDVALAGAARVFIQRYG